MKKLLGSALTLALVFPSGPASAELLKNAKVMGGIDFQAVSARNVTDFQTNRNPAVGAVAAGTGNDRVGTAMFRTWAGLGWDLLDDVHAMVTLRKNDRAWGTTGSNAGAQGAGGSQAVGYTDTAAHSATANNGLLGNLFVDQANVKLDKLFGHLDSTFGRQFWGEPGDLIAFWGPKNTYGLFVTAVDAVAVNASNDWMNFMGIAGRTTAGQAIGATLGNPVDVRGIDVAWKMMPMKVNTFVWNQVTHGSGALGQAPLGGNPTNAGTLGGLNDNLWLYGLKLRGEGMGGWISATLAANGGTNRRTAAALGVGAPVIPVTSANYIGKALLLDMGYKLDVADIGGFTPWATFGWGSGRHSTAENKNQDFRTIASDFRPGVIYGRFNGAGALALGGATATGGVGTYDGVGGVSAPGLTNRIIWGGGLKFNCANHQKMTAGLSYWNFNYQKATDWPGNAGGNPKASGVGNRSIGSELDFQLDWAHSENVMLSAGAARFMPGGFVKEMVRSATGGSGVGVSPVSMLFADMSVKF